MTVLEPTAAWPGEDSASSAEPELLRRCLLLAVPIALSAALVVAALNSSFLLHAPGMRPAAVPPPQAAAEPPPSERGLTAAFTPEVRYWSDEIQRWSVDFGLAPDLVATVMQIESCGDPSAVSRAGAQGLFQVMPYHFAPGENPLDPETNARRGLAYLAESLSRAGGRLDLALAGYNGGHGVITWPPETWPDETRRYAAWGTGVLGDVAAWPAGGEGLNAWLAAGGSRLCAQAAARLGLSG